VIAVSIIGRRVLVMVLLALARITAIVLLGPIIKKHINMP
jgi:hypothetical protein